MFLGLGGVAVVAMSETGPGQTGPASGRGRTGGRSSDRKAARPAGRRDIPDVVEQFKGLKGRAADAAGSIRATAGSAVQQVKQKATDMTRAIQGTIQEEAERLFEEQKGKAASKVARCGKLIHQAAHALNAVNADGLADFADGAAEKVEEVTGYLEERNLAQVLQDAGEAARRHPGVMLGGMFVAGFALARFLKASDSPHDAESEGDSGDEEGESAASSSRSRRSSRGR